MKSLEEIYGIAQKSASRVGGLLSDQYQQGKPYRDTILGLLNGDTAPFNETFNTPRPASTREALEIALGFSPMMLGTTKAANVYSQLAATNRQTVPKVPVSNVFKNSYGEVPSQARQLIDSYMDAGRVTDIPYAKVDISKIVPTQRNVNIDNLKRVSKVKNPSDDIVAVQSGGKVYLIDGHHRVANSLLNKETEVLMRLLP
jgi:hypothetical protein